MGKIWLVVLLTITAIIAGVFIYFDRAQAPAQDIVVTSPEVNEIILSPVKVGGRARGSWFFEASAPVRVYDANGVELGAAPMQAQGEWMTMDFVPFAGAIEFAQPKTDTGTVVFKNDNPSGIPEKDKYYSVPVRFR